LASDQLIRWSFTFTGPGEARGVIRGEMAAGPGRRPPTFRRYLIDIGLRLDSLF
jgi:hypothetical protein